LYASDRTFILIATDLHAIIITAAAAADALKVYQELQETHIEKQNHILLIQTWHQALCSPGLEPGLNGGEQPQGRSTSGNTFRHTVNAAAL
jgi:hypothetical protein